MELTLEQALVRARKLKLEQSYQEADKIYTLILKQFPGQIQASIELGDIALKYKKPDISYNLILNAIRANPKVEQLWIALSRLLKAFGQDVVNESDRICKNTNDVKLLAVDKKLAQQVKKELKKGNTIGIIKKCEQLLQRKQSTEYTILTLAVCYQLQGNKKKEEDLLSEYCEVYKSSSRLRFMFANNLFLQENYSKALVEAAWLVGQYPDYAHALQLIGVTLQKVSNISASIAFLKLALEIDGDDSNSLTALGDAYRLSTQYGVAKDFYQKALEMKPDNVTAATNLGLAYRKLGQYQDALDIYMKLAEAANSKINFYNNIGALYFDQGDMKQAEKYLKRAIKKFPMDGSAHRHLTLTRKYSGNETQINDLLKLVENVQVGDDSKSQARFALGKIFDDAGDYENAFKNFSIGNQMRKRLSGYSIDQDRQLFDRIQAAYSKEISTTIHDPEKAKRPIFILGMPRSGTTLTEQILSSHSEVYGAGELDTFSLAVVNSGVLSNVGKHTYEKIAVSYLRELETLPARENFITDKMPLNFRWIGFIMKSLPNASIILVERDRIAVAWSIFRQFFSTIGNGFANDLDDIAEYLRLYQNQTNFWKAEFGDRIYNLKYENLTENQEQETRSLLDYVGLDFEEQCMTFQNNKRAVQTASNAQVRKGLYTGSSMVWKNYEPFLSDWIKKNRDILG